MPSKSPRRRDRCGNPWPRGPRCASQQPELTRKNSTAEGGVKDDAGAKRALHQRSRAGHSVHASPHEMAHEPVGAAQDGRSHEEHPARNGQLCYLLRGPNILQLVLRGSFPRDLPVQSSRPDRHHIWCGEIRRDAGQISEGQDRAFHPSPDMATLMMSRIFPMIIGAPCGWNVS